MALKSSSGGNERHTRPADRDIGGRMRDTIRGFMSVMILAAMFSGCTAKKQATATVLEEKTRRPGGTLTVPPSSGEGGKMGGETPAGAGR